jgi:beta-galactosidase
MNRFIALFLLQLLPSLMLHAGEVEVPDYTPVPVSVDQIATPVIRLDGIWKFCPDPDPDFWKKILTNRLEWFDIQVPGEWLMQGFSVDPGTRTAYWKRFTVPGDWKGSRVMLKCDGLYSDAVVFVKGRPVGTHMGGVTPA